MVAVAYQRSGGEFGENLPGWFSTIEQIVGIVISPILLFILVPLMRKDGATVGQVCVFLRSEKVGGGTLVPLDHLKKFGSRWGPWMVLAFLAPVGVAFPVLILGELGSVLARQDRP